MATEIQTLDLSALLPVRHKFKGADGKAYEFKSRTEFGAVDYARLMRLQNKAQAAVDRLNAEAGDPVKAAEDMEAAFYDLTAMILPDVPEEHIHAMNMGQMNLIWEFWQKNEGIEDEEAEGEAEAG